MLKQKENTPWKGNMYQGIKHYLVLLIVLVLIKHEETIINVPEQKHHLVHLQNDVSLLVHLQNDVSLLVHLQNQGIEHTI
jgi:hypothetical protein